MKRVRDLAPFAGERADSEAADRRRHPAVPAKPCKSPWPPGP